MGEAAGCSELASDTDIANLDSQRLHAALGFAETGGVFTAKRWADQGGLALPLMRQLLGAQQDLLQIVLVNIEQIPSISASCRSARVMETASIGRLAGLASAGASACG